MCSLSKEQSREPILNAYFFTELCPFFDLNFLSSIKHPTAKQWHPHDVLLLKPLLLHKRLWMKSLTHSHTMIPFDAPGKQAFENTVGKGEIARNEKLSLKKFNSLANNKVLAVTILKAVATNKLNVAKKRRFLSLIE